MKWMIGWDVMNVKEMRMQVVKKEEGRHERWMMCRFR